MTDMKPITVEIQNTCNCEAYWCEECYVMNWESTCEECEATLEQDYTYDCGGTCWEEMKEDAQFFWEALQERRPSDTGFYTITGIDIGWRRLRGQKIVTVDVELWEQISVDTEWTQRWSFDNETGELIIVQSHHDAPTGETYTVAPTTEKELRAMEMAL